MPVLLAERRLGGWFVVVELHHRGGDLQEGLAFAKAVVEEADAQP
jgi:hypothetical protein